MYKNKVTYKNSSKRRTNAYAYARLLNVIARNVTRVRARIWFTD